MTIFSIPLTSMVYIPGKNNQVRKALSSPNLSNRTLGPLQSSIPDYLKPPLGNSNMKQRGISDLLVFLSCFSCLELSSAYDVRSSLELVRGLNHGLDG